MKKPFSILCFLLLGFASLNAQNSQKENDSDDFGKQMAQMQKLMAEQMKKMFGSGEDNDSTQTFNFAFKNLPFSQLDTSMTQSFGMLFDGKNWQTLGDSSMGQSLRDLQDRMPDFGKGFNMEDIMKSFGDLFKDGSMMSPYSDDMPRVQPNTKKRKAEEPKKKGKYQTESL